MLKKLKTLYNTKQKSIIRKLGCIAAHRKALLAIILIKPHNNLILEQDADLMNTLLYLKILAIWVGGLYHRVLQELVKKKLI